MLARIAAVADVDARLDKLDAEIAAAKAKVPSAKTALGAATTARDAAKAGLDSVITDERAKSRDAAAYEERRNQARRALKAGLGDLLAAEKQDRQCSHILDGLETELLVLMEKREQAEKGLVAADAKVVEATKSVAAATDNESAVVPRVSGERATVAKSREAAFAELDRETQSRYSVLRENKRTAVALVVEDGCKLCLRDIPAQMLQEIRSGKFMHACRGCGRWLLPPA